MFLFILHIDASICLGMMDGPEVIIKEFLKIYFQGKALFPLVEGRASSLQRISTMDSDSSSARIKASRKSASYSTVLL